MRRLLLATMLTVVWLGVLAQAPAPPFKLFSGYFESLDASQLNRVNDGLRGNARPTTDLIEMDVELLHGIQGVSSALQAAQLNDFVQNATIVPEFRFQLSESLTAFTVYLRHKPAQTGLGAPGSWSSDRVMLLVFDGQTCLQAHSLSGLERWKFVSTVGQPGTINTHSQLVDLDGDNAVELVTRSWRSHKPEWGGPASYNMLKVCTLAANGFQLASQFSLDTLAGERAEAVKLSTELLEETEEATRLSIELKNTSQHTITVNKNSLFSGFDVTVEFDIPGFGWRTLYTMDQLAIALPEGDIEVPQGDELKVVLTIPAPWTHFYKNKPDPETLASNVYHFDWTGSMQLKCRVVVAGYAVTKTGLAANGLNGRVKSKPFPLYR